MDRHHHSWCRCANQPGLIAGDPVADAVHLNKVTGGPGYRHDVEGRSAEPEPALEGAQPVEVDVHGLPVHLQPVPTRTDLGHNHPMGLPLVAQLDLATHGMAGPRATAPGRAEEGTPLEGLLGVILVDGNTEQGDRGVRGRCRGAGVVDVVHPARVRLTRDHLWTSQQVQQEGLVGGATAQNDGGLAHGTPQPGQRLGAVLPPGDDLGDHRVVAGGYHIP